ncbi:asparagine synthase (glutamine-hydrolyzing) [Sandaracinus amylolyticus]|uniref:asparagine synthase (glutamine-hydrolyzing) n=1 Tax=Sandaracinus amylolyticus TaxID=927083 RepID=A0A0F6W446_9BACT|nr:asparagine synthase (glutamine-hydrolyzing) [Sandaracinus amylolyticus]AKF07006.1 Asparagine synthetase [Sandaracinus amylolyticus]
MCGISGIWSIEGRGDALRARAAVMRDSLAHRGPDDAGEWEDATCGLVLGQRRLSILDLSPLGHQPMMSASSRYVVVFNGEIYNHLRIREDLPDARFRGTSDTETLLAAIERWGLEGALSRFVGMFAIALWDREARTLQLVRDRVGIKPLYWGRTTRGDLLFGSELRALRTHPEFDTTIDREALTAYFETSCVPAPLSIHRAARKLEPGTILTFHSPRRDPRATRYWRVEDVARDGARDWLRDSEPEILERIEETLRDAVRLRLLSDVPLGAFLSGGIDSSLVVAIAQELSTEPLRTYSIGSTDAAYDESGFASEVARRLGTRHTALTVRDAEAREIVPQLASIYDEPFADSSQIPTFLVSRLARNDVTVALSGDGGDELFGGYNRYLWAPRLARVQSVPRTARRVAAAALELLPTSAWDSVHAHLSPPLPPVRLVGDKLHKGARALRTSSLDEMYAALRRQWWPSPVLDVLTHDESPRTGRMVDAAHALMVRDAVGYLPDDILTKVDRASMAVALEARVPILDHRVVELAWRVPMRMKIRDRKGKWALRELLAKRLPRDVFERPKTGFSVPVGAWLRGPLRDWAESLLDAKSLASVGLDARLVRTRWKAHQEGPADAGLALWDVLAFAAWHREITRGARAEPRDLSARSSA